MGETSGDESASKRTLGWVGAAVGLVMLMGASVIWCTWEMLVIREVGIDGETTLRGPSGRELSAARGTVYDEFPITIELDLGTTYGGFESETVGGSLYVPPNQNCNLAEPMECTPDSCTATITVTDSGMCAYSVHLESDRGGGVGSCPHFLFPESREQYERWMERWEEADGGPYIQGPRAVAYERCAMEGE